MSFAKEVLEIVKANRYDLPETIYLAVEAWYDSQGVRVPREEVERQVKDALLFIVGEHQLRGGYDADAKSEEEAS